MFTKKKKKKKVLIYMKLPPFQNPKYATALNTIQSATKCTIHCNKTKR